MPMRITIYSCVLCIILFSKETNAQHLKPGFDKSEFIEMLRIGARTTVDSTYFNSFPTPAHYKMIYQSSQVGLDNLWQLWMNEDSVAVISIRGTTKTSVSFLANLYAATVAAKGTL